jgi:hypothetical protein
VDRHSAAGAFMRRSPGVKGDGARFSSPANVGYFGTRPGMLEFWADPTSPYHREEFCTQRRTILYCASSGRSALAVRTLQSLGSEVWTSGSESGAFGA